jgi:hypothetical protein
MLHQECKAKHIIMPSSPKITIITTTSILQQQQPTRPWANMPGVREELQCSPLGVPPHQMHPGDCGATASRLCKNGFAMRGMLDEQIISVWKSVLGRS